ncbi:uncharacterized protein LOC129305432 [Prosopis cineraria]|uniref:uncharacterized protein LOC129305432 n=1 Tax=Prosopis cineraria TaxID=364024 RepID=UPI0024103F46|nr:uncharacterized protein LOC129305432 [Prosopis cineraria]
MNLSSPTGAFVRTSRACLKLEFKFSDKVSMIALICLPLSSIDVIVGMDWLSANGVTLDCNRKIVSLPVYTVITVNPEPGKLLSVVDYETPNFLTALQVEKLMREGCQAFMIYCSTHEVYDGGIDRIGVVNKFPKVFDDQMSGLPPEREIKFFIDLVPDTKPISKALYHMAPTKLEELKKQLKELLEKGFIWPRFSQVASALTKLTKKDQPFVWTEKCEQAFQTLKEKLTIVLVLTILDPKWPYVVYTDASLNGLGCVLMQDDQSCSSHVETVKTA